MADINNFSDLSDNFDTIKTMLNSIRAQGILNTSDVDKLLEGINSKLEKINTEEDIDLIKAFLSELKKNLDERHEVLVSKFGAIESLFSNLLKNSSELAKSGELKELFDIVATNLSVFSREVVSQKETLTDITLRLDAMRSDDSQKKDIIKSVNSVRNDIEKVNNGFDSIVISLNENFKTVLKTIAEVDQSEAIKGFTEQLTDILNSSNSILSAIQLIDKKNTQFEDAFDGLAKKDDTANMRREIVELSSKSQELINLVDVLTQKSYKIDNLSEKIDAAVDIIASLKTNITDKNDENKNVILDKLTQLEATVREVASDSEFEEFKQTLTISLNEISKGSAQLKSAVDSALSNIEKLNDDLKTLDINKGFQNVCSNMLSVGEDIKEKVVSETDKISQILDVNLTRTLNDISTNAEVLNSRLKDSHTLISDLCEKSFADVSAGISGLREVVAQIDENNVSANNAIFSNITDRLAIFENSLKNSLEKQEDFVSGSSDNVVKQIVNIKSLAEGIEYKLDANAIELGNTKREFSELTDSVNRVLALDFVNTVKDLKLELYASKQDLTDAIESSQNETAEKFTNDLFGKYELLVSKLDSVEDELKLAQTEAMDNLKTILTNISASIVDILSYVSTVKDANNDVIESKLSEVTTFIQDTNLNYIENVRDVVDVIRSQVEANLNQMREEADERLGKIRATVIQSNDGVKQDLKTTYDKLLEVQNNIKSLNEILDVNNGNLSENVSNILNSTDLLKDDFDGKIKSLEHSLLDMVTNFKNEFTCENADKISELKFNAEMLNSKVIQQSIDLKNELKTELDGIIDSLRKNILTLNELIAGSSLKIEGANKEVIDFVKNDFTSEVNNSIETIKTNTADVLSEIENKVDNVVNDVNIMDNSVNNLSTSVTNALSSTLSKILENFVALNTLIENINQKNTEDSIKNAEDVKSSITLMKERFNDIKDAVDKHLDNQADIISENHTAFERLINNLDNSTKENFNNSVIELKEEFSILKKKIADVDSQVDEDLARQVSIIEGNFESLNLMLVDIMNQATDSLGEKIHKELSGAASQMSESLAEELEQYKTQIEDLFEGVQSKNNEQAEFIKNCALELNSVLEQTLSQNNKNYIIQIEDIGTRLKEILNENIESSSADYDSLKSNLNEFIERIERNNNVLVDTIKAQLDDITKFVNSNLDIHAQEVNSSFEEISSGIQKAISTVRDFNNDWSPKLADFKLAIDDLRNETQSLFEDNKMNFITHLNTSNEKLNEDITNKIAEFKIDFANLNNKIDNNDEYAKNISETQINEFKELNNKFNILTGEYKEFIKNELSEVTDSIKTNNNEHQVILNSSIDEKIEYLNNQIDNVKQNSNICKDLIFGLIKEHSDLITKNIERESDVLVNDIVNQFNLIKDFQKDELTAMTSTIEGSILGYINDAIDDIKSYLDIKNDTSTLEGSISGQINDAVEGIKSYFDDKTDTSVFEGLIIDDIHNAVEEIKSCINDNNDITVIESFIADIIKNTTDDIKSYMDIKTNSSDIKDLISDSVTGAVTEIKSHLDTKTDTTVIEELIADSITGAVNDIKSHLDTKADAAVIEGLISDGISNAVDDIKSHLDTKTDAAVIEGLVSDGISNAVDDIKSYLDIKTDSSTIENDISGYIIDAVNDLKSYLDVKNNTSTIDGKLDALRNDLIKSVDETTENINKLLEVSVFTDAITDLRATNEVLITSMSDKINSQIQEFVKENVTKKFDEKIGLLDKKFIDTVVDKYEEIKVLSTGYNKSFERISVSVEELISKFSDSKNEINEILKSLLGNVNKSVDDLKTSFAELKAQILNKSFDEAFHTSVHNQISGIETLVKEQIGYIEDISDLCCTNLPELAEMSAIVKHSIQDSILDIRVKLDNQETNVEKELNTLKTDIITQFINVFNQISFVAEQEEILDFIQEKHSELITILSHIVTTVDGVETVKDNLAVVDNKLDSLKEDIDLINEKITSIMSSEGDIDYVYSLQDLETDIANLRLVLNEMKSDNKSKEFEELISSTNNIYQMVESIKNELPKFEADEFKKDFNSLAEDIVSISTRTNKLILTSDESYKTLQDNLQDFKLVIDDLDERTRNFAHESGIDKLDHKLGAINTMIQNGAKTNQVFNQIFEYLAEWVDKAGEQITSISDKVETLDDISQIKIMLEDLRAENQDNTDSEELVDALEKVFDKQAKRISSLEAKLDKIIVNSTTEKKNKSDIKPIEDTLNKFLSAIEDKFISQQDKINSLETKLEEVVSLVDNKDTAQLTKKVGGMDRQLAKLNKSIEKIASNVVEK